MTDKLKNSSISKKSKCRKMGVKKLKCKNNKKT
jgi:hypothetical protein